MQKIWRVIYPVLIYFFVTIFVRFVADIIISTYYFYNLSVMPGDAGRSAMYEFAEGIINELDSNSIYISMVSLIIVFAIVYKIYKKEKVALEKSEIPSFNMGIIAVFAIVMSTGFSRLISLLFSYNGNNSYEEVENNLLNGNIYIVLFCVGLLAPVVEEIIFRGLIYNRLKQYTSLQMATVISAVMFGIYHFNFSQGMYACFLGLALAFLYERFKTLWVPVFFHIVSNITSIILTKTGLSEFLSKNFFVYLVLMFIELGLTMLLFYIISKKNKH